MTQANEQRQYHRLAVTLPARFHVLIPEATFRPIGYDCEVNDISERGAMLNVRLTPDNYRLMLQKTRYCRLDFELMDGLPERVTGRAVWLQPEGNGAERSFRIGLFFEDCPAEIVSALRSFVEKNRSQADSSR